ncbi:hypothetical protein ACEYW6_33480, partial [Nostoc sp. UIC 10607]|uniref:hypothetical protein n=1 Tax=Nostoc sp. UIC 10607 TaxID=3045935 RepID=UPI0039A3BA99
PWFHTYLYSNTNEYSHLCKKPTPVRGGAGAISYVLQKPSQPQAPNSEPEPQPTPVKTQRRRNKS